MFHDQEMQNHFSDLSAEKQAEVADFIHFLHQKQARASATATPNQAKIAELLLGTNAPDDPESMQIWDEVVALEETMICAEPTLET